ncbi:bacitracin ABC transporter permease [Pontibacillus halophilus JSM 076056 = DSM 19796]|uniref:Bacitracin ABC transporter permease n=1 Tax=Pontibacillus halophilus JSM 076056 = DSM 19796 TaxID=1385510 RepID=A0A0A5I684_9BACI|nr:ABC transporter permease [Pontibacillus halophilus]KGX91342.1 bacitracin ABC transporter permease [Pontibacillus halophilus JSM 076056 = DSM 19796]
MSINSLILKNLRKNLRHYYLYVFALIFSVALYFSFVTLQFDPQIDSETGSVKGEAGIRVASYLLLAIVGVFLLYANSIFVKRRSREIGLFQLVGMTKGRVFRIVSFENLILYCGSFLLGVGIGFTVSKLTKMILFKVTGVSGIAQLNFSVDALLQSLLVFAVLYVLISIMNAVFIKRHNILSLFRVVSSTETKVGRITVWEIIMGVLGFLLILSGYYVSSTLFSGSLGSINTLFLKMMYTLASVIVGTYFFYKGSVRFITNLLRKRKGGYLNVNEVLSLSSIMFRMKSNAFVLTIITTVSALAIGLLSLSYISYYSTETNAKERIPFDFAMTTNETTNEFKAALDEEGIQYEEINREIVMANVKVEDILAEDYEEGSFNPNEMTISIISEATVDGIDVAVDEMYFSGYSDLLANVIRMNEQGTVSLQTKEDSYDMSYLGMKEDSYVTWTFNMGGLPTGIVDEEQFAALQQEQDPTLQKESSFLVGMNLIHSNDKEKALSLFRDLGYRQNDNAYSQEDHKQLLRQAFGLSMFIVGYLGLAFLTTSGCILYFKQMGEGEEEQPNYVILRKLGYTQRDLLRGIRGKQLFSFGIPLLVGLIHSYFAVKSGWFYFGTELWAPMVIVMIVYTLLYSGFGALSVLYYKKLIRHSL